MPGSIQSIERAAAVLRLVAGGPRRLRLAEIAASLELPKGTAHGILRTLAEVGFVTQDRATGRYALGPAMLQLASARIDPHELRARSMNWVDPLAARTAEAASVGVLVGAEVLVVHDVFRPVDCPEPTAVGALLPAHATALGKVLLAHGPHEASMLPAGLTAYTSRTITSRTGLVPELAQVREHGYAVDYGEHRSGHAAIAAPIHAYGRLVVGAVAIQGTVARLCTPAGGAQPHLLEQVVHCARAVTRELTTAREQATARAMG